MTRITFFSFLLGFILVEACGVKGPPLPPVPVTPQKSDPAAASPTPKPTSTSTR